MPTRRAWTLAGVALAFYFLANQTQIGWLYLISNALLAALLVAWLFGWRSLRALRATRHLHPPDALPGETDGALTFHEDDSLAVTLQVQQSGTRPLFNVRGVEHCPVAPPAERAQPFFVPRLMRGETVTLRYTTRCDRRGLHRFGPIPVRSHGPFGLFRRRAPLDVTTELLVYPFFHPLRRLRALDQALAPQRPTRRAGVGSEVIGVREYRPGDPPRTVHWRSSARANRLVVKEFAAEEQPTLTVALDLSREGTVGEGKFSTFETAVRLAASLGHYATQRNVPVRLVAASPRWQPPRGPLSWWAILSYLARVENDGDEPFDHVLRGVAGVPVLAALVSRADEATVRALQALPQRGTRVLALFVTPDGAPPPAAEGLRAPGLTVLTVSPTNWMEGLEEGRGKLQGPGLRMMNSSMTPSDR